VAKAGAPPARAQHQRVRQRWQLSSAAKLAHFVCSAGAGPPTWQQRLRHAASFHCVGIKSICSRANRQLQHTHNPTAWRLAFSGGGVNLNLATV